MASLIERARETREDALRARAQSMRLRARVHAQVDQHARQRADYAAAAASNAAHAWEMTLASPWSRLRWHRPRDLDDIVEVIR